METEFLRLLAAIISTQSEKLCIISIAEELNDTTCDVIRLMEIVESKWEKSKKEKSNVAK
tara:strand:- start:389 stop:568 length:180 start_codon:yes stop_codon:yes gene_type:complete